MKNLLPAFFCVLVMLSSCAQKPAYKATLIELMSPDCGACINLAPDIEQLKKEYKGLVDFKIIDVNSEEGQQKTSLYGLKHTPTIIFLDANGMEYFRLEETMQKDVIAALLNTKTGPPVIKK